ncbi:MAG TPA: hypothetical protein VIQ31_08260 [Phormidium sp.]
MKYYTLVRHTGYSVSGKMGFKNAVELRGVTLTDKQVAVLRTNKAVVLTEYVEISNKEEAINYPQGNNSLYPSANESGCFKVLKGSGIKEEIFIPNPLTLPQ